MSYIKRIYSIWCRMRWLKRIDREVDRYNHLKQKMNRQRYVIKELTKGYTEAYGESLNAEGGQA